MVVEFEDGIVKTYRCRWYRGQEFDSDTEAPVAVTIEDAVEVYLVPITGEEILNEKRVPYIKDLLAYLVDTGVKWSKAVLFGNAGAVIKSAHVN